MCNDQKNTTFLTFQLLTEVKPDYCKIQPGKLHYVVTLHNTREVSDSSSPMKDFRVQLCISLLRIKLQNRNCSLNECTFSVIAVWIKEEATCCLYHNRPAVYIWFSELSQGLKRDLQFPPTALTHFTATFTLHTGFFQMALCPANEECSAWQMHQCLPHPKTPVGCLWIIHWMNSVKYENKLEEALLCCCCYSIHLFIRLRTVVHMELTAMLSDAM